MSSKIPLITVLGPTAVGKTSFAAHLARSVGGEIISADSRQVYREMNIGTGKDLGDYIIDGQAIKSHLIDIADPGTEYNVFRFQQDFRIAYETIIASGRIPILCGGTGMYLESVLSGYNLVDVPEDEKLRKQLSVYSDDELIKKISSFRLLHNTTDTLDRERLIRAIEIEVYKEKAATDKGLIDFSKSPVFGIRFSRNTIRERITVRLTQRINEGMLPEVQNLLDKGISKEKLLLYGLEYRYITLYLTGELTYSEMFTLLNTAIHQFAKRQMTWFRRMERKGINIYWLEGEQGLVHNLERALIRINSDYVN